MAPPKVSLNSKPPPPEVHTVDETLSQDKKDSSIPSFVGVGEPSVVSGTVCCLPRNRRRLGAALICIGFIISAITVTAAVLIAKRHHYMQNDSWESYLMFNGQRFTENIRSDPRQLIFVTRDYQDENIVEMKAVLDYRMHVAAYRDCTYLRCFIERLQGNFQDDLQLWRSYREYGRTPRRMRIVRPEIELTELSDVGGQEIIAICQGVPAYWVLPDSQGTDVPAGQDDYNGGDVPNNNADDLVDPTPQPEADPMRRKRDSHEHGRRPGHDGSHEHRHRPGHDDSHEHNDPSHGDHMMGMTGAPPGTEIPPLSDSNDPDIVYL